jgi:hypothetical protein
MTTTAIAKPRVSKAEKARQATIAQQIADEQDNRAMQLQTGQHELAEDAKPTLVTIDVMFDVPAPINAMAWALRSAANNAMWNAFTAFQNKDRKAPTLNNLDDLPDYLRDMMTPGAEDNARPATENDGPLGLEAAPVRSSWMVWAELYKALVAECLKVTQTVDLMKAGDRVVDGKIQRGMVSYIRTPAQEAEYRSTPRNKALDETENRVLVPDRFKHAVKEGTVTQQQRLQKLETERNTEAAVEITAYLKRCERKAVLQPHEAYSFLSRFKEDFERSVTNDITKPRLMNIDGTLKEEALGEMALADGFAKLIELEMKAIAKDHGDSVIMH